MYLYVWFYEIPLIVCQHNTAKIVEFHIIIHTILKIDVAPLEYSAIMSIVYL